MTVRSIVLIWIITGFVGTSYAQDEPSSSHIQKEVRISVTDFGAQPDSRKDAGPAIRRALAACREAMTAGKDAPAGSKKPGSKATMPADKSGDPFRVRPAVVLVFPKGRYDLYADSAIKKEYFISNTSSETECPSKVKTIGILLEDIKGLRIEGEGSLLLFHGKMITFAFDHCDNVLVRHLSVDFERPTMSEFTITGSTPTVIDVQVHPDSWHRLDSGKLVWYGEGWVDKYYHCVRVDTVTRAMYDAGEEYEKLIGSQITETAPSRLQFRGAFDTTRFHPGNVFTVRDPVRDEVGVFIVSSKNISLQNVAMHYMHGLGIVGQYSENILMDSVLVEPRKGSGRWMASFADGMHFSGCRGKIEITHCRFFGMQDDAVNVHGTHLKIVKMPSDHEAILRFMHPQTYGFRAFFEKDSIAFVHPSTLAIYAYGSVKTARRLSDREILLTFRKVVRVGIGAGRSSRIISPRIQMGDVIENITWTPRVIIRHNVIAGTNTRGVLVTTCRKVVIEDNTFDRLGMQAILIGDDALSWFESGPVRNLSIRHNIITECGHNSLPENYAIAIVPENHELTPAPVHRNIQIENNRFICYTGAILTARSVEGLAFVGNTVSYTRPFSGIPGMKGELLASDPDSIKAGGIRRDTIPNFRLVSCTKVMIKNNDIDPNLPGRL